MTEAEEEDVKATVVMRVADLPVPHTEGSRQIECTHCGAKCWISPATLAATAVLGITNIWCFVCAHAQVVESGEEPEWLN